MSGKEDAFPNAIDWALSNRLSAIGYTWLGGVGTFLAYEWTRPTPMSLKLIHTRVYAQGITLAALCGLGALEVWAQSKGHKSAREMREDEVW
eukprot:scaffold9.g3125.t1